MLELPKCTTCKTPMTLAIDCIMYISPEGRKLEATLDTGNNPVRIFCSNCGNYIVQTYVDELVPCADVVLNSQES